MASVDSRVMVFTTPLRPAVVSTATFRTLPAGAFGHSNVTWRGVANMTGTRLPLTFTTTPPNSKLWPDQSEAMVEDSHAPRNVAKESGEHTASLEPLAAFISSSITGMPGCTSMSVEIGSGQ